MPRIAVECELSCDLCGIVTMATILVYSYEYVPKCGPEDGVFVISGNFWSFGGAPGSPELVEKTKKLCRSKFRNTPLFEGLGRGGGKNNGGKECRFCDIYRWTLPYTY